jgi:hypothetical protein
MPWDITVGPLFRREPSVHVVARWADPSTINDVTLEAGPGVKRETFGGADRREIAEWSDPMQSVFRWHADVAEPRAILEWTDQTGQRVQKLIDLAASTDGCFTDLAG